MKILVCGSRNWKNVERITGVLKELKQRYGDLLIIHGGCRGADRIAGTVAGVMGLRVAEFPADWDGLGRRAGIVRNLQMLDEEPDLVIAFQLGGSKGTQHTIEEALKRGIKTKVYLD